MPHYISTNCMDEHAQVIEKKQNLAVTFNPIAERISATVPRNFRNNNELNTLKCKRHVKSGTTGTISPTGEVVKNRKTRSNAAGYVVEPVSNPTGRVGIFHFHNTSRLQNICQARGETRVREKKTNVTQTNRRDVSVMFS